MTVQEIALSPEYIDRLRTNAEAGIPIAPPVVVLLCRLLDAREKMLDGKERQVAELLTTVQQQAAIIRGLRGER